MKVFLQLFGLLIILASNIEGTKKKPAVMVFTVATEYNDGLKRYLRSATMYEISPEVLGMGKKWEGGNMESVGGGQKVVLLKEKLESIEKPIDRELIILFTDSYDVIFMAKLDAIVERFMQTRRRVVFSAEPFCWPDQSLSKYYPEKGESNAFLNSGGFIGYYDDVLEMLKFGNIDNSDDDQLFYTNVYLDEVKKGRRHIGLDHRCNIFQNLNGALSDVEVVTKSADEDWPYLKNVVFNSRPLILHGNGPSKLKMNYLSNYLAKAWSAKHGCAMCKERKITLQPDSLPSVLLAMFIEQATPFLEEFLGQITAMDYPKNKIHLFVHNNIEYHEPLVNAWFEKERKKYLSASKIKPKDYKTEGEARGLALEHCAKSVCEYMFSIDSIARVEPFTLTYLMTTGYNVVAPLLVRPGQAWSNFWGAVSSAGFYARSNDYMDIVNKRIIGIWNVPFITNCYLVKMAVIRNVTNKSIDFIDGEVDPDITFCAKLRKKGIMMFVSNEKEFGHLVNPDSFDVTHTNPDIYEVFENSLEWEKRYISPEYPQNFEKDRKHRMPCTDVYWFPVMTPRFCKEWIEIMEAYGKWSDGSNHDKRLEGGYEAVPTRDIHMKQVGLDSHWLYILKKYVRPLQELVFTGYFHNPPVSVMNFVVRYRPDEQPSLRPHHDSSTYTINLALNTAGVDYEGGGCRFIRYNCSVTTTKVGWMLMHPGRLTHYHEGLRVTNGTRYIMISFVDP